MDSKGWGDLSLDTMGSSTRNDLSTEPGETEPRGGIGDDEFEGLVRGSLKGVYSAVLKYAGNPHDADDLTQQAFLQAYRKLASFQAGTDFEAWVKRIAANLAVDSARRKRRRKEVSLPQPDLLPAPGGDSSREEGEARRLEAKAREFMEELPADQRVVMALRIYEDRSPGEIAKILGCPVGTVWWRLHAARQKLWKKIGPLLDREQRGNRGEEP